MMRYSPLKTVLVLLLTSLFPMLSEGQKVLVLNINTPIYVSTSDYIKEGIQKATQENANCIILKINTPGGLLKPTRKIVGSIMQSPIPIISFVAPSGSHAGSAGSFIALSADLSVMAPGTNIGAAHPVTNGGEIPDSVMNEKVTNDAVAFIQSIADKRHRDAVLLTEMVTDSRSFSAKQALNHHIIDLLATNMSDLTKKINHITLPLLSGDTVVLHTKNATLQHFDVSNKDRLLNTLNNPNVMYVLLLFGLLGILFEIFHPGSLFPGIVGVICLILSAYGMTLLPMNFTGLALIVLAIILFLLELKFASYGVLTVSGIASLFLGAIFLIKPRPSFDVITLSWTVIIASVVITALFFIFLITLGLKAQLNKQRTGRQSMKGKRGKVMEDLSPIGRVRVEGEIWHAVSEDNNFIKKGAKIEVVSINAFKVTVKEIPLPK